MTDRALSGFRFVEIFQDDTLQAIAARQIGDAERWPDLVTINGLAFPYLTGDPSQASSTVKLYGDLLLVPATGPVASSADPAAVFGIDLALSNGQLDGQGGDFALVGGRANLKQSVLNRLITEFRELLFHPTYGCGLRELVGSLNGPTAGLLGAQYVKAALLADKRIATVDDASATVRGDAIEVSATIQPVAGQAFTVTQGSEVAFQIKSFTAIVAGAINHIRGTQSRLTDFNVGSAARTMIEAPAVEIDELYQQLFTGLKEAIPVSTYNTFNFSAAPAAPATGRVRVSITPQAAPVTLAAGIKFAATGGAIGYATAADAVIPTGASYVDVTVSAITAGSAGNIGAGSAFTLTPSPTGFASATNLVAFRNGADAETPDQLKQRFNAFVSNLARSTLSGLAYGAGTAALYDASGLEIERVRSANVVEPWLTDNTQPIALVKVYVHNGVGGTSSALVARAQQVIDGYIDPATGAHVPGFKAAGVVVQVLASTELTVNVGGAIRLAPGFVAATVQTQAAQAIAAYIAGLGIGQPFLVSEAVYLLMALPGVANVTLSGPTVDQPATGAQRIIAGSLTFTAS